MGAWVDPPEGVQGILCAPFLWIPHFAGPWGILCAGPCAQSKYTAIESGRLDNSPDLCMTSLPIQWNGVLYAPAEVYLVGPEGT